MIAFNHALTGAVIGLTVGSPAIAVPAALVSHFVCDSLPHYGAGGDDRQLLASRRFAVQLVVDAVLCGLLVLTLGLAAPLHWQLAALCAFVATSPDFAWLPRYLAVRNKRPEPKSNGLFTRFAKNIQWFERPIGAVVELAWAVAGVIFVVAYL
jgi:hypothetical protein